MISPSQDEYVVLTGDLKSSRKLGERAKIQDLHSLQLVRLWTCRIPSCDRPGAAGRAGGFRSICERDMGSRLRRRDRSRPLV